jgi:30S ribosomal protein S31
LTDISDYLNYHHMGKGDKKTKRGKIIIGTYGVRRPHKKGTKHVIDLTTDQTKKKEKEKIKKTVESPSPVITTPPEEKVATAPETVVAEVQTVEAVATSPEEEKAVVKPIPVAEEPPDKPAPKKTTRKPESKAKAPAKKKPKPDDSETAKAG